MQVTPPNEIWRPGVRLHSKACAALGLEAERATPKHLRTPVPRTCRHALVTRYARTSGGPLGFRPRERKCGSTGAHPPGETSTSCSGQAALLVLYGAALWGVTSQVNRDGSRLPSSSAEPLHVPHSGNPRNPWGPSPLPSAPTYLLYVRTALRTLFHCMHESYAKQE